MLIPKATDAHHKAWMYRLLTAIADDIFLSTTIFFKGGTAAAMRGFLDRFSIDLDFDLPDLSKMDKVKIHLEKIFKRIGLLIHDQSKNYPQYFLKYDSRPGQRNTLKLDISFPVPRNNDYEPVRFEEIDRILMSQTLPTMFANKLVAVMGRFKQNRALAGRDLFDVHTFLLRGCAFKKEIIEELTGKSANDYLKELKAFIAKYFTQQVIDEDLNHLLPLDKFKKIRKIIKQEVLAFLS